MTTKGACSATFVSLATLAATLSGAGCGGIAVSPPEPTTTTATGTGTGTGNSNGTEANTGTGTGSGTGAGTSSGSSPGTLVAIPPGTYSSCGENASPNYSGEFMGGGGYQAGAQLVLTRDGERFTATFTDPNGTTKLGFAQDGPATASLTSGGQMTFPFSTECVTSGAAPPFSAASLDATTGALVYEAGTVFVALQGPMSSSGDGSCGAPPGQGTLWIGCTSGESAAPGTPAAASTVTSSSAGTYTCASQVDVLAPTAGVEEYSLGNGVGTLVITQDGTEVRAAYSDDLYVNGTMSLTTTTDATAAAVADQTLSVLCVVPSGSQTLQPLPVTAGAFTSFSDDGTLLLSFAGTTGASSACPGTQVVGTLFCLPPMGAGGP